MSNKTLGDQGEAYAADYLRQNGYRILTRNYRTKVGEIDLIADDHGTLVFIEVKTRRGMHYGTPATSQAGRANAPPPLTRRPTTRTSTPVLSSPTTTKN